MGIVENWRPIFVLGLGLAGAAVTPAFAQTVVGGDWRPQVEIDSGVLERLGPQPTLPDLLLGRQPMAPAGSAVTLHRPRHSVASAATTKPATEPKLALSKPKSKPKPDKVAVADSPTPTPTDTAPAATPKPPAAKSTKTLVSSYEAPPPPATRHTPAPVNADMPAQPADQSAVAKPDDKKTSVKPAAATPPAVPAAAPPKVTVEAPPPPTKLAVTPETPATPPAAPVAAATPTPAAVTPTPTPPSPPAQADKPAGSSKQALLTPPPPVVTHDAGGNVSIGFAIDGASLGDDGKGELVGVAKRAEADAAVQIQILAYASGDDASKARRLSLSRALAVRSFLIDQGVHSSRIEVRALGNKVPDGSPDRVDLVEQKH